MIDLTQNDVETEKKERETEEKIVKRGKEGEFKEEERGKKKKWKEEREEEREEEEEEKEERGKKKKGGEEREEEEEEEEGEEKEREVGETPEERGAREAQLYIKKSQKYNRLCCQILDKMEDLDNKDRVRNIASSQSVEWFEQFYGSMSKICRAIIKQEKLARAGVAISSKVMQKLRQRLKELQSREAVDLVTGCVPSSDPREREFDRCIHRLLKREVDDAFLDVLSLFDQVRSALIASRMSSVARWSDAEFDKVLRVCNGVYERLDRFQHMNRPSDRLFLDKLIEKVKCMLDHLDCTIEYRRDHPKLFCSE